MTVLLVEDDDTVRDLLARVLRGDGHTVLTAESGEAAEALMASGRAQVDLLVCDVCLPGENGPALAERLARSQPGMRLLLMSGDPTQDGATPRSPLAAEFLGKPFSNRRFLDSVHGLLAR